MLNIQLCVDYCRLSVTFASVKLVINNQSTKDMEIKTLKTASLSDALMAMKVGETAFAPVGYHPKTVRVECSKLKEKGLLFSTTMRAGAQTVTRLK